MQGQRVDGHVVGTSATRYSRRVHGFSCRCRIGAECMMEHSERTAEVLAWASGDDVARCAGAVCYRGRVTARGGGRIHSSFVWTPVAACGVEVAELGLSGESRSVYRCSVQSDTGVPRVSHVPQGSVSSAETDGTAGSGRTAMLMSNRG